MVSLAFNISLLINYEIVGVLGSLAAVGLNVNFCHLDGRLDCFFAAPSKELRLHWCYCSAGTSITNLHTFCILVKLQRCM